MNSFVREEAINKSLFIVTHLLTFFSFTMATANALKVIPPLKKEGKKTFQAYLPEGARTYNCAHCRANLADHSELISKVCGFWKFS